MRGVRHSPVLFLLTRRALSVLNLNKFSSTRRRTRTRRSLCRRLLTDDTLNNSKDNKDNKNNKTKNIDDKTSSHSVSSSDMNSSGLPLSSSSSRHLDEGSRSTSHHHVPSEQPPSSTTKDNPPTGRTWNVSSYTAAINNSLQHIEQNLMNRIQESNKEKFRMKMGITIAVIAIFVALFGDNIKSKLKSTTTDLALETLEDKAIKIQTEELARAVVQTVLNDRDVTAQAASFLREASRAPETQEALLKLTLHVIKHPDSLKELSLLTKNVLAALSNDPEAIKHLAELFVEVFRDSELKQQLNIVACDICKSPDVMAAATELTSLVFQEPAVQAAVNDILVEGSSNVMKNEEISVQSRQFVAEVMGDDALQREGGNALWNSIYHAIVPGAIR